MAYIFLIAVSLALDAFAVSVSAGLTVKGFGTRHAVKLGVWFGSFQFIMPLVGWLLGSAVAEIVSSVSPIIAFALLAFIGGRMVLGALKKDRGGEETLTELKAGRLFVLAVATSIDALAAGVTFAFMDVSILSASAVIGAVAFILSVLGGKLGGRLGERFQERAELLGGAVLIAIGAKILIESFIK